MPRTPRPHSAGSAERFEITFVEEVGDLFLGLQRPGYHGRFRHHLPATKMRYGTLKVLTAQVVLLLLPVLGQAAPHNLILFVPDGLRSQVVDRATAPTLARLRDDGVDFTNSHSLFPTFTTANASAFATGHRLGDTG